MKTLIKYVRHLVIAVLVVALFATLLLTHSQVRYNLGTSENFILPEVAGKDITADVENNEVAAFSNDGRTMYVSKGGIIKVLNDATNEKLWCNTASENDVRLLGTDADATSPLSISYRYDGETDITLYSGTDSTDNDQYSVSYSEDGSRLRISYLFGETGQGGILPKGITQECMEKELLPKLSKDEQNFLLRRYTLATSKTAKSIILEECPGVKNTPLYYLDDCSSESMKNKTIDYLKKSGMNDQLFKEQCEKTGEIAVTYDESYSVTIEYWLDNGDIMVNIPCDEIKFHPENPLTNIMLNGSATYATSSEDGDYFLPAGSGALQSFYSTTERSNDYRYYGSNELDSESFKREEQFPLPVFGVLRKNSTSLMGVIEEGAEAATLKERFSDGASQLMLDLSLLEYGDSSVTVQQTSTVFNSAVYQGDFTVRYRTLEPGTDMSSFAVAYRDLLKSQNKLPDEQKNTDTMLLEMIGNVSYSYQLAGLIPVNKNLVLTNWQQSLDICQLLNKNGLQPSVKLSGYNKNGLFCQEPGKYIFANCLGNKNKQETFLKTLSDNDQSVFIDLNMAYCYVGKNQIFSSYSYQKESSRKPNNKAATSTIKSISTGDALKKAGVLNITSPSKYLSYAQSYNKKLDSRYNISLGDSLLSLNVDYSEKHSYNRSDTLSALNKSIDTLSESRAVMTQNPVLSTLGSISICENLSLKGDNKYSVTEYVPFVQMVLHGHVNYSSKPLNAQSNYKTALLKAVETGSALKYTIAGKYNDLITETEYDYLYYADWEKWKDTIISDAKSVNELYEKIGSAEIIKYENNGDVVITAYSNGTEVFVNYSDDETEVNGIKIQPQSWTVITR